jgi:lipopolysaccharide transport system ATP-binding protein
MSILEVCNVGKTYRKYDSQWHRFLSWMVPGFQSHRENWVLNNVTFSIHSGEAVGIVGQNGAGKSTLLKLVTGVTRPNTGSIGVNGRIAAILELGMGFNPEFTGRQNAYNALSMMGFTHDSIVQVLPEIEEFAEIGNYFDQSVRIYSSGMQMRVAFAVATAFRPDILIVDEALSVGDAYFQHKSFAKIREFRELGTTLLLVSHDHAAILSICPRALLIEKGELLMDSSSEEVLDYYKALIAEKENATIETRRLSTGELQIVSGTQEVTFESISLCDSRGIENEIFEVGDEILLSASIRVNAPEVSAVVFGFGIKDRLGQDIFGTNTWHTKDVIDHPVVGECYEIHVRFNLQLGVGNYSIVAALHDEQTHLGKNYEWINMAVMFSVVNTQHDHFNGIAWLDPQITVIKRDK